MSVLLQLQEKKSPPPSSIITAGIFVKLQHRLNSHFMLEDSIEHPEELLFVASGDWRIFLMLLLNGNGDDVTIENQGPELDEFY